MISMIMAQVLVGSATAFCSHNQLLNALPIPDRRPPQIILRVGPTRRSIIFFVMIRPKKLLPSEMTFFKYSINLHCQGKLFYPRCKCNQR